jgi:hypothetical protein
MPLFGRTVPDCSVTAKLQRTCDVVSVKSNALLKNPNQYESAPKTQFEKSAYA